MTIGRRGFLVALGSVPFLQLPVSVPATPVPGWTFLWHGWSAAPVGHLGMWTATNGTRGVFNPVLASSASDRARAEGYEEIVRLVEQLKPLDPYHRYWLDRRV